MYLCSDNINLQMNKKQLLVLSVAIALVCAFFVLSKKYPYNNQTPVSPTDDSSQFVTLTDAVPDAILEIRYFGTYNFVGTRIDGYLEPTALLTRQGGRQPQGRKRRCESSGLSPEDL